MHSLGVRSLLLQSSSLPEPRAYEDDNITTGSAHNMLYQIPGRKKQNPDRWRWCFIRKQQAMRITASNSRKAMAARDTITCLYVTSGIEEACVELVNVNTLHVSSVYSIGAIPADATTLGFPLCTISTLFQKGNTTCTPY
jgi:hypothetical protein